MYKINELSQINLGRQGENKATIVEIDVSEWLAEYPTADINILAMRSGDTAPYIAVTSVSNNVLSWVITASDTQYSGRGKAEIRATVNDIIKKSATAVTYIAPSIEGEPSPTPPEPSQGWVDEVIAAKESIENMSATAEVDNNVGTPSVTVTKSIVDDHTNLDFDFKNLKGEKGDPGQVDIDQHYDPTSENAQSGKAVAEAVDPKQDKFGDISGNYIVTDKGIVFTDYAPKSDVTPENPGDLTTKSYVDAEIENHHDNTKADKSTTYTKTEVNTALSGKADKSTVDNHIADTNNPHLVTKTQVGLGNVDNTSDLDKPISTATQTALDSKANASDVYTKTQADTLLENKENIIRDITPYVDYTVDSQTNEVTITNLKSGVTPSSLIGRFRIPETITIDGVARTVTTIGGTCFYNCINADFILPSTLTTIEDGTATSSLPAYAHGAFSNTKITNADPNPNMYVGEGAFYNCEYITSVRIPYGVTLGNACFIACNNIKKVVIGEGITNAGSNTFFSNTSLFELLLPETLTTMGNAAFANAKLKKLYLPKSVTNIATNAFSNVVLTDLYFGGTQTEFAAKSYETIFTNMTSITIHYNCKPAILQDIYDYHDSTKQDKLTAGTNITIDPVTNEISASGGGGTWRKIYEKTLTAQDEAQEITINTDLNGNNFVLSDVKIFVLSPIDTEQKQGYIQIKEDRTDTGVVRKQFGIVTFARTTYKNQMLAEGHTSTDFVSYFNIGSGVPGTNLMTPNGFTPSNNPPANFSKIEWIKLKLNSGNFKEGTYIIISGLDKV